MALLTVAVTLESCIFAGFYVSHMDLSPNYGGALMGLSNGCGSVMGILAPLLVGLFLGHREEVMIYPSRERLLMAGLKDVVQDGGWP